MCHAAGGEHHEVAGGGVVRQIRHRGVSTGTATPIPSELIRTIIMRPVAVLNFIVAYLFTLIPLSLITTVLDRFVKILKISIAKLLVGHY